MLAAGIKELQHVIIQTNHKPFKLQQTGNPQPVTGIGLPGEGLKRLPR